MNTKPTANASYHEWIDYYNKMLVGQIKPELDIAWQKRLRKIFSDLRPSAYGIKQHNGSPANCIYTTDTPTAQITNIIQ